MKVGYLAEPRTFITSKLVRREWYQFWKPRRMIVEQHTTIPAGTPMLDFEGKSMEEAYNEYNYDENR